MGLIRLQDFCRVSHTDLYTARLQYSGCGITMDNNNNNPYEQFLVLKKYRNKTP